MPREIPNREAILQMEDAEFAQVLMQDLYQEENGGFGWQPTRTSGSISDGGFLMSNRVTEIATESVGGGHGFHSHPPEDVANKAYAAYSWLQSRGYLAPAVGQDGMFRLTDNGRKAAQSLPEIPLPVVDNLPMEALHPKLRTRAWQDFIRKDYSGAIFKAFQEVEQEVRRKGNFDATDTGKVLMQKAFHKETGPLRDQQAQTSEREAMGSFFAGAFGIFRNPNGHRAVEYTDPILAQRQLETADLLLRVLDRIEGASG